MIVSILYMSGQVCVCSSCCRRLHTDLLCNVQTVKPSQLHQSWQVHLIFLLQTNHLFGLCMMMRSLSSVFHEKRWPRSRLQSCSEGATTPDSKSSLCPERTLPLCINGWPPAAVQLPLNLLCLIVTMHPSRYQHWGHHCCHCRKPCLHPEVFSQDAEPSHEL